jgi:hypothetical protein
VQLTLSHCMALAMQRECPPSFIVGTFISKFRRISLLGMVSPKPELPAVIFLEEMDLSRIGEQFLYIVIGAS